MKVAFWGRDGTVNRDYPDHAWKNADAPELLEGAVLGMKHLKKRGVGIILIRNQYLIGEGIITLAQFYRFHGRLLKLLERNHINVLDTFFCPHARSEHCDCCKPKPGLSRQALEKYPDIVVPESLMCGDSVNDLLCAESMGLRFYGIHVGKDQMKDLSGLCVLV